MSPAVFPYVWLALCAVGHIQLVIADFRCSRAPDERIATSAPRGMEVAENWRNSATALRIEVSRFMVVSFTFPMELA